MVVESHDDFPGVEISIAGGVGEMVRVVRQHQFPVQYILGSDTLSFLRALIVVLNDVHYLVVMHSHLITECCGRC